MPDPLRAAVIGCTGKGNYGHGIDTVWASIPEVTVVAVADEHEAGLASAQQRLKAPAAYASYREMLEKERPQIVGIGPRWIDQHAEIAIAAAEHGCHVYMEKPFVRTGAEADAVVSAFEMRHRKLALAHQTRYSPVTHMVRDLIRQGEIGDLLEMRGRGKEDARGGGEDLWVLGSHVLDLMRFFAGDADSCTATMFADGHPVTRADVKPGNEGLGPLAGDAIWARYTFKNGVIGDIATIRGRGGNPSRFGLQLFGSKGVIDVVTGYLEPAWILKDPGWSPGRSKVNWQPISSNGIDKDETLSGRGLGGGNIAAVNNLLESIDKDKQPECNMYEGRAVTEMILSVFESHRVGKTVPLPLATRENPLSRLG